MNRSEYNRSVKRLVVKVGTSTITYPTCRLNPGPHGRIVREIADPTDQSGHK